MAKRIFSTLLLWSIVIGLLWGLGPLGAVVLTVVATLGTLREFYRMVSAMGLDPFDKLGTTLGGVIAALPALELPQVQAALGGWHLPAGFGPAELGAIAVVLFSVRILGEREPATRTETLAWSLFGIVYVAVMLQFLGRIAVIDPAHPLHGVALAVWTVVATKFCDVGALLTGMAIGRHKMSPVISPKKTWEGAAGGVVISAALAATIVHLGAAWFPPSFSPLEAALLAAPLAALGIVADLVESIIKRRANVKDSGGAFPGIGGIFDVTDSLILTAPIAYGAFRILLY